MRFQEVKLGRWLGINGEADVLPLNYSRHLESIISFVFDRLQSILPQKSVIESSDGPILLYRCQPDSEAASKAGHKVHLKKYLTQLEMAIV
jgi:hypothetical protein